MVNIPAAWARSLTENPQNAVVGATYDVEMINGLDYLLKQGKIKEGDKLGHIYFEGEYGENGLAGLEVLRQAARHGRSTRQQIKSTDTDMTAQVTAVQGQRRQGHRRSPWRPGDRLGRRRRRLRSGWTCRSLGNNPVFAPALLDGPAGPALIGAPVRRLAGHAVRQAARPAQGLPGEVPGYPTLGVVLGYAAPSSWTRSWTRRATTAT